MPLARCAKKTKLPPCSTFVPQQSTLRSMCLAFTSCRLTAWMQRNSKESLDFPNKHLYLSSVIRGKSQAGCGKAKSCRISRLRGRGGRDFRMGSERSPRGTRNQQGHRIGASGSYCSGSHGPQRSYAFPICQSGVHLASRICGRWVNFCRHHGLVRHGNTDFENAMERTDGKLLQKITSNTNKLYVSSTNPGSESSAVFLPHRLPTQR